MKKGDIVFAIKVFAKIELLEGARVASECKLHQKATNTCPQIPNHPDLNRVEPNDFNDEPGTFVDNPSSIFVGTIAGGVQVITGTFRGEVDVQENTNIKLTWGYDYTVTVNPAQGTVVVTVTTIPP